MGRCSCDFGNCAHLIKITSSCNKLDVDDQIAVNTCTHQVLEIDFPTSNIKIGQELMIGEAC